MYVPNSAKPKEHSKKFGLYPKAMENDKQLPERNERESCFVF